MEFKKFNEYSQNEKEELLMHWFHYYGKILVTVEEIEKFYELVKSDSNLIKDAAMVAYVLGESSQGIINAMRTNNLDNYFEDIKSYVTSARYRTIAEEAEDMFFEQVVDTYNNPEPSVKMSEEQFMESLNAIVGMDCGAYTVVDVSVINKEDSEPILTADVVKELYSDCTLREDEIKNEEPIVDFVLGEGVGSTSVFSAERIEKNKGTIALLFDELGQIDEGISFLVMCNDKYDRQWTGFHSIVDGLVQLGIASGVVQYTLPRDMWDILPGGMPYVIRNRVKDNEKIEGIKPIQYKKIKEEYEQKNS